MIGLIVIGAITVGILGFLTYALVKGIRQNRNPKRSIVREFGLGIFLMALFAASWVGHGIAQWQVYESEQKAHGEPVEVVDYLSEFANGTMENWQSEFLQLFSFVSLAAVYIHKKSAESRDGEDDISASLKRIEVHLGTLPDDGSIELPETSLEVND